MSLKGNLVLLAALTISAIYMVDLRIGIQHQTKLYAKAQEQNNRLKQGEAALTSELNMNSDARLVLEAAKQMDMFKPSENEVIYVEKH